MDLRHAKLKAETAENAPVENECPAFIVNNNINTLYAIFYGSRVIHVADSLVQNSWQQKSYDFVAISTGCFFS